MLSNLFMDQDAAQSVEGFIARLTALGVLDADASRIASMAKTAIGYYSGDLLQRSFMRRSQEIEKRWYASLKAGTPDYTVYADDCMLAEVLACWRVYSRKYCLALRQRQDLRDAIGHVRSVADLGCGLGYTTASLAQIWPKADVFGTNFDDSLQRRFLDRVADDCGFAVRDTVDEIGQPCDLVFASEYFEHIQAPIDHLRVVLSLLQPKVLVIANAFGAKSVGHFDEYLIDGVANHHRKTSTKFNVFLRDQGYTKMETKLWNNRPTFWKKEL